MATRPGAPPSPFHVRHFREEDRLRLVEIHRLIHPGDRRDVERSREDDELQRKLGLYSLRLVAESAGGAVVGAGRIAPERPPPDDWPVYSLLVHVDPAHQRRGIGSALCERLLDAVRARGGSALRARLQETRRDSLAFLERRGFAELERTWESNLDLASFDFATFESALRRAAGQGIQLTTFAAERKRGADAARSLHHLIQICSPDVPSVEPPSPWPFEQFVQDNLESPGFLPDAWFIAIHGDRYVGASQLRQSRSDPALLRQWFTCVLPEYRGRGIALALKLKTVEYARDHCHREIRTMNSTLNRPMLRINEALGFLKYPTWITMEKRLDHPTPETV